MVMAQSLFMTLKREYPDALIDVLAPQWSLPILERMPEVARGIAMPLGHGQLGLSKRRQLGQDLKGLGHAHAIVLPRSLKSALVPWFAGIPKRTGFRGEMRYGLINDMRALDRKRLPMTVQRFVALGLPPSNSTPPTVPRPHLQTSRGNLARLRKDLGLDDAKPASVFMPGAEFGPAKQWPVSHFAELARQRVAQGEQVWILGSDRDHRVGQLIADLAGADSDVHNLCGRTQLVDAVDLIADARVAVTNDSGLMHVAAAVNTPLVALYGSSTPQHTPPLADRAAILYLGISCAPCFKRECPLGHTRCLHDISPQQVTQSIKGLDA